MKTMTHNVWQLIYQSVDWLSVKFMGASLFIAAIIPTALLEVLSATLVVSGIIYNFIRIYKELKKKKEDVKD